MPCRNSRRTLGVRFVGLSKGLRDRVDAPAEAGHAWVAEPQGIRMTKGIRVVVADDHPVVLAGIKALIQSTPEIELVGEASNGQEALQLIIAKAPDIAIIDVSMPGLSGAELARRLSQQCPGVKILVLTMHEDRAYVQQLLQVGANGYLLKRSAADELIRAIRVILAGDLYVDPSLASKLLGRVAAGRGPEIGAALSQREEEVLRLAAQGFSNKEAAAKLQLSVKTIETYRARAAEKLGLRTRAEIVRYGAARGWLDKP